MLISQWADKTPDAPAIVMAGSGETVTFRQLVERSNQAAQLFRGLGLNAGDHIAFMIDNQPLFFELCWAAKLSGLKYTPISTYLAAEDAAYILADCGAKVFVASGRVSDVAIDAVKLVPQQIHCYVAGEISKSFRSWEREVARFPATEITGPPFGADMSYSSGTTGRPKGVVKAPEAIPIGHPNATMERSYPGYGFSSTTRFLVPNPAYHSAPMRFSMIVHMLGGCVVLMERFDPENALKAIDEHKVNHGLFVPTMFVRMLQLEEKVRCAYDISSLKQVMHAAAPCPTAIKEKMINWWGPIITEFYGSTEECGFTVISSEEWLDRKGSVGRPIYGIFHILDDSGNELPAGTVGTIWVEGTSGFSYYKDTAKTEKATNERGWQTVGDLGYADDQGYIYLAGRNAFTINSGGVKISPKEVEDVLCAHPLVIEAAVFGVPDSEFGEQVKAVVQLVNYTDAGPETESVLIDYCRSRLSRIKAPKSIDFESALPRDAVGKLAKKALKARYWPTAQTGNS